MNWIEKLKKGIDASKAWKSGKLQLPSLFSSPPRTPARPSKPRLLQPRDMPRRRGEGIKQRVALLHSLAHIEYNAINLAWDLITRFSFITWPTEFYDDWIQVAIDEARHFELLNKRLKYYSSEYGALPAHGRMWETATQTSHNPLSRLALVPLNLELRGLDVSPKIINRLNKAGDHESADLIDVISTDEIKHVAAGWRWFSWLCDSFDLNPEHTYNELTHRLFPVSHKHPFNETARKQAGLPSSLCKQALD